MSRRTTFLLTLGLTVVLGILLAACSGATQVVPPTPVPAQPTPQPAPTCPAAPVCPTQAPAPTTAPAAPAVQAPFEELWANSPHNDAEGEPFAHWNEEADKMVPASCAKCHSTTGFLDFVGADGSEAGKVDKPAPIGTTVTCQACHNDVTANMTSVVFPSGVEITNLGPEARCMQCHQGRASKKSVDDQIAKFKAADPLDADKAVLPIKDGEKTVNFGFINIHYYAAAATLFGSQTHGGYEYEGKAYDVKFDHVIGIDNCVACHNPHSTELKLETCAECHEGVKTKEDLKTIRMKSSAPDYDGDGDVKEGVSAELDGVREVLYTAIKSYAKDLQGVGIVYDAAAHPYFFNDRDNDGTPDKNDKGANVAYNTWTPRLLKAAYNYQVATKDPGAYAHGNKYIIQLMYDSIEDINKSPLATKIDITKMHREDAGHFAGDTMPFRDWDAEGMVPAGCAKCHSAGGLPEFIANGGTMVVGSNGTTYTTGVARHPVVNGFQCSTCHDTANFPATYKPADVTFPSGAKATFVKEGDADAVLAKAQAANLCIECHQGRESTVSVNNVLKGLNPDEPSAKIRFKNIHYFAAGATLFGSEVKGIYQYDGKEYAGRFMHEGTLNKCTDCHDAHELEPKTALCAGCHTESAGDVKKIRKSSSADFDGDKAEEGLGGELEGFQTALYAAIQAYAKDTAKAGILYDSHAYPYFFLDANGDGTPDQNDKGANVAYNAWTPKLLKAAYNYQYSIKDPGSYIHNFKYVAQALFDSIQDLGGSTTGLTRP